MIKKLVGLVVIIAILAIGVVAFGSSNTKNPNSTSAIKQPSVVAITNSSQANNINKPTMTQKSQNKVSPAEAQKIANRYILEPGAVAGTPKLIKQNTQMVYLVPVIMNGKQVGEIYIDAQTGKNLGGAGGAP
jgi:uncharacterized membrane protein YkoI